MELSKVKTSSTMSKRTVLNENYKGLVETLPIPAELHERDGKRFASFGAVLPIHCALPEQVTIVHCFLASKRQLQGVVESFPNPAELHERDGKRFASFGSVLPIHCALPEQVEALAQTTHHYCDVFSDDLLAPLGELAYVRIDETMAEKVFINRTKRILLVSSDGAMAQWRCAATFESANQFVAGTPIVNKDGALVSVVTAKRGNNYAVSTFEGEGGYFETSEAWQVFDAADDSIIYGTQSFPTRDAVRDHVAALPPAAVDAQTPPQPVLHRGAHARIVLVAKNGRQLAHHYLQGVLTTDIEYL